MVLFVEAIPVGIASTNSTNDSLNVNFLFMQPLVLYSVPEAACTKRFNAEYRKIFDILTINITVECNGCCACYVSMQSNTE